MQLKSFNFKISRLIASSLLLGAFALIFPNQIHAQRLGLLGNKPTYESLTAEERAAYDWAQANFQTTYISFEQINSNPGFLNFVDALWWHFDELTSIPVIAKEANITTAISDFVQNGGGLFLSGFAPQYVVNLGFEDTKPQEIRRGLTTSGSWGFSQKDAGHEIFTGLSNPFSTLSAGLQVWNSICWWNNPQSFDGIWLADVEWNSNILVTAGEYEAGTGKVIVIGAGAYDWHIDSGNNSNQSNLEKFTENILNYILPEPKIKVALLGTKANFDSLSAEEKAAYDWAHHVAATSYLSFESLQIAPTQLENFEMIWWHFDESDTLPENSTTEIVMQSIRDFVASGGGMLLSGFATQYVLPLGFEDTPPQEISKIPSTSSAAGFWRKADAHPIFEELINPVVTLSSNLQVDNLTCWWTDEATFDGEWLGDTVFRSGKIACGEYQHMLGKVIVIGSPAFDWQVDTGGNSYRENLEKFASQIFSYLKKSENKPATDLMAWWALDDASGKTTVDSISETSYAIRNNFNNPEWVDGVSGSALRLDGYSTWIFGDLDPLNNAFTFEAWLALETYPVRDGAIVNQRNANGGYFFGLTKLGEWYASVFLGGVWYKCVALEPMPKNEWVHVAATFDKTFGLKLYLDGEQKAALLTPSTSITPANGVDLVVGRNNDSEFIGGTFPAGVLNGIIDEIKIYTVARSDADILQDFQAQTPSAAPNFSIPDSRFADDHHRPQFHALPPANWTNEPHGLIQFEGKYHLFYQKNPNGPYWEQIHWGHMTSDNLVNWQEQEIALAPEAGFDQRGIWSGCSMNDDGELKVMYTAVDGVKARMALASWEAQSKKMQKLGVKLDGPPAQYDHLDFRDPFIWQENGNWYMIIGSGIRNQGGTVFLYKSSDLNNWEFLRPLMIGQPETSGDFWEMPIFVPFGENKYLFLVNKLPAPANAIYWIGTWKNEEFIPDFDEPKQLELFNHMLSPTVTFDEKGRLLAIGIVPERRSSGEQLAAGWAHLYSLPRIWTPGADGTVVQQPVPELQALRQNHQRFENIKIASGQSDFLQNIVGNQLEISVEIDPGNSTHTGIKFLRSSGGGEETRLYYDATTKELALDLTNSSANRGVDLGLYRAPIDLQSNGKMKLHIFIDHSIIDVFINNSVTFSKRVYPTLSDSRGVDLFSTGGTATAVSIDVWKIESQTTSVESIEQSGSIIPMDFELKPVYPNPFWQGELAHSAGAKIEFVLKKNAAVKLIIYDVLGRPLRTLVNSQTPAGNHIAQWDGRLDSGHFATAGVYFIKLHVDAVANTRKILFVR
ncbi:MAG: DUF4960 domain-containing protein [Calditrichaeota bacterium]|nr:MAG: DUF4960 domain-containing protein [Calditrichota bacterium]